MESELQVLNESTELSSTLKLIDKKTRIWIHGSEQTLSTLQNYLDLFNERLYEKRLRCLVLSMNVERQPLGKVETKPTRITSFMAHLESKFGIITSIMNH
jgi:hypothetical protein